MPHFVFTDAKVEVNSIDLSDHVREVGLNLDGDVPDATVMGKTTKVKLNGLKDWSVTLKFAQDFAAGEVDATLFPLWGSTAFPVTVRPDNAARSATNPEYSGNCLLSNYQPLSGSVGDLAEAPITLAGSDTLSRLTSSTA